MLNVRETGETGRYHVVPGEAWSHGFTTYGGYVAAAAYRALRLAGHDRPLLSAQVNFMAPTAASGFEIAVEALRIGKNTSVIEAVVWSRRAKDSQKNAQENTQEDSQKDRESAPVMATKVLFTLGQARKASLTVCQRLSDAQVQAFVQRRDETANVSIPAHCYTQFHYRPLVQGLLFAGTQALEHAIACRPRFALDGTAAEALLLLSDINPAPQLCLLDAPVGISSTASWMITFEQPALDLLEADWFYILISLETAANGYGSHTSQVYDSKGRHLSSNRQLTTVFEVNGSNRPQTSRVRHLTFKAGFSLLRAAFAIKGWIQSKRLR